jgi:hypothetical protein
MILYISLYDDGYYVTSNKDSSFYFPFVNKTMMAAVVVEQMLVHVH